MSADEILKVSSVSLWCAERIPYGSQITILSAPEQVGNRWVASTLGISSARVELDREVQAGERLIILKRNGPHHNLFGYVGVPADKLDVITEEITKTVTANLRF